MFSEDYPEEPTSLAKVKSEEYGGKLLGENELGTVHIHGPYGNTESSVKIAYLIGMHPLESKSHRALFETVLDKSDELSYCYYIYNTDVYVVDEETEGRMSGQLLAQEFIAPHVIDNKYTFVVDVHANKGLRGPGKYEKTNFLFAPGFDENSEKFMNILLSNITDIEYYAPEYRTSPEFITIPIKDAGIPVLVYETFSYEPMSKTYDLAGKLVMNVDKLEF
ncbi:adhesin [Methanosphaera sp.]